MLGGIIPIPSCATIADADNIKNTSISYIWSNSYGYQPIITVMSQTAAGGAVDRGFQIYIKEKSKIDFRYIWGGDWLSWNTLV